MKQTPFHEVGLESGAQMVELFGYFLPWEYAPGHEAEHERTRSAASLCDLDYMGEFRIEGPDSGALIQQMATNDYSEKTIGSIGYTAMCDDGGNMIDDGTVWRLAEDEYMLVSGDEEDFAWVERNADGLDAKVTNITSEHTTLALQGPLSDQVLRAVTEFPLETLRYYRFSHAEVAGVDCLLARMGYTGEFGYELHFHPQQGAHVWSEIMRAGADVGIVPLGQAALESLRQEAGYLLVGNDHDKTTNPLEAGIGFTVRFDKERFNGKPALTEIVQRGVNRRMVWLDIPSGAVAEKGDSILFGDKEVGRVTSGSFSPTRRRGTAMGYVTPAQAIPGLMCSIEVQGKREDARLSVMPLFDPGDTRTRASAPR
jgi:aminomethyltransferase